MPQEWQRYDTPVHLRHGTPFGPTSAHFLLGYEDTFYAGSFEYEQKQESEYETRSSVTASTATPASQPVAQWYSCSSESSEELDTIHDPAFLSTESGGKPNPRR